jgi:hypothetical protein
MEEAFQLFPCIVGNKRPYWTSYAHPDWMIGYNPAYMAKNRPEWVAEHHPSEMAVYNPAWLYEFRPDLLERYAPDYVGWEEEMEMDVDNIWANL